MYMSLGKSRSFCRDATAQLDRYISIISCSQRGSAHPGLDDSRLLCQKGGQDVLWGYVIICVAGMRVICRQTTRRATECNYIFTGTQFSTTLKEKATQFSA